MKNSELKRNELNNNQIAAKVADVVKATVQFLNLVEESAEPHYQGYRFIDLTLLRVHCPAFSKLTEAEAVELVKALDFAIILPEEVGDEDIVEPIFSLNILWDKDKLKSEVYNSLIRLLLKIGG